MPEDESFDVRPILGTLEALHREVRDYLNAGHAKKTPVFLYYNHSHFRQNTISPAAAGAEAFAEAFKNRLVIPARYSDYDMEHLIAHELSHISQFEVLYGGYWRSPRLVKAMMGLEPLWVLEGQAEHIAHKILGRQWSSYDRMILRDAVLYDYLYSLRELQNFSALYRRTYLGYKIGHYAMDFLTETEGEEVNFRLLKALRNNLDPMKAFETASFKFAGLHDFDAKWQGRLREETLEFAEGRAQGPGRGTETVADGYHSRNPVSGPEGGIYYISDRWLKDEIYFRSPDGQERRILRGFFGSTAENLVSGHRYDRILDYSPDKDLLAFFASRNQENFLCLYSAHDRRSRMITIGELHEPRSPAFSRDGEKIVFTALRDGMRNIYTYNTITESVDRVTDDNYIDFGPVFTNEGYILAASERNGVTDLRVIGNDGEYRWLTGSPYNEIHPRVSPSGEIYFSADPDGVFNIYKYADDEGEHLRLTNLSGGAFYPAPDRDGFFASCYYDGSYKIVRFDGTPPVYEAAKVPDFDKKPGDFYVLKDPDISISPARSRFSTDFFLPSFLYSTDTGFIGGGYYKGSDMLGIHDVNFYLWGWPGRYEASAGYALRKWRSDIFLSVSASGEEFNALDPAGEVSRYAESRFSGALGLQYPLSAFSAASAWVSAASLDLKNRTSGWDTHETETGAGVGYMRSTAVLRPFHAVRGSVLSLSAYAARPLESSGVDFNRYEASLRNFTPLARRLTLASRIFAGRREGPDASEYSLNSSASGLTGSPYSLRGYGRGDFTGDGVFAANLELRWLALDDLNWHIYFIWPDINIYSLSIKLFTDAGTAWDARLPGAESWGYSWGSALQLNLYLLQMAPVHINLEFATPYDSSAWRSTLTFSSGHITW